MPEDPGSKSAFGKGYWLFFGFAGGIFAAIAIAIPMVIITSASSPQPTLSSPPTVAPLLPGEAGGSYHIHINVKITSAPAVDVRDALPAKPETAA